MGGYIFWNEIRKDWRVSEIENEPMEAKEPDESVQLKQQIQAQQKQIQVFAEALSEIQVLIKAQQNVLNNLAVMMQTRGKWWFIYIGF